MSQLTTPRWIWIVLTDGRPLRMWPDTKMMHHGQHGDGFESYDLARIVKRAKLRDCADMMERVKHDPACVARWSATYKSVTIIRIKLPEGARPS